MGKADRKGSQRWGNGGMKWGRKRDGRSIKRGRKKTLKGWELKIIEMTKCDTTQLLWKPYVLGGDDIQNT